MNDQGQDQDQEQDHDPEQDQPDTDTEQESLEKEKTPEDNKKDFQTEKKEEPSDEECASPKEESAVQSVSQEDVQEKKEEDKEDSKEEEKEEKEESPVATNKVEEENVERETAEAGDISEKASKEETSKDEAASEDASSVETSSDETAPKEETSNESASGEKSSTKEATNEETSNEEALPVAEEKSPAETQESQKNIGQKILAGLKKIKDGFCSWKKWQQILCIVLVVILVLCCVLYGYFHSKYVLMDISDGDFSSTEITEDDKEQDELENEELEERQESGELEEMEAIESTAEVAEDEDVFNILLIGTDDRTQEFSENARGDTCILLSINRETEEINLVSFERAIGVKIPYGEYEGQWDWLTHTFWYGGPSMMMNVIQENFKVDVTKYIRVNIYTFMELVDAVGGVDIEMTEAEVDNINHPEGTFTEGNIKGMHVEDEVQQDLVVGVNHLNGATAMLYARLRSIDDDWHRVVRQRNVILAAVKSMKSMSITELDAMLNSVLPLVQTNLSEADIASLIPDVPTFLEMDFGSITFPLSNTYGLMDGMSGRRVLALDFETNAQELQNLLYGETTADELTEKYENIEETQEYSYRDSESYQENYADAEGIAGYSYYSSSSSYSSSDTDTEEVETGEDEENIFDSEWDYSSDIYSVEETIDYDETEDESVTSWDNPESSDSDEISSGEEDTSSSSSLGEIESVTTDPTTGIVTTIYYNSDTGVRTAIAINPENGATTSAVDGVSSYTGDSYEEETEEVGNVEDETLSIDDNGSQSEDEEDDETFLTGNAAAEAYAASQAAGETE